MIFDNKKLPLSSSQRQAISYELLYSV